MTKNVGTLDRFLRLLGAIGLITGAFVAPLPTYVRLLAFGGSGLYMLGTVFFGVCFGYKLLGRSTCAFERADGA
jgi:DUF2892 family protein